MLPHLHEHLPRLLSVLCFIRCSYSAPQPAPSTAVALSSTAKPSSSPTSAPTTSKTTIAVITTLAILILLSSFSALYILYRRPCHPPLTALAPHHARKPSKPSSLFTTTSSPTASPQINSKPSPLLRDPTLKQPRAPAPAPLYALPLTRGLRQMTFQELPMSPNSTARAYALSMGSRNGMVVGAGKPLPATPGEGEAALLYPRSPEKGFGGVEWGNDYRVGRVRKFCEVEGEGRAWI